MTVIRDTLSSAVFPGLGWGLLHSLWQFTLTAMVLAVVPGSSPDTAIVANEATASSNEPTRVEPPADAETGAVKGVSMELSAPKRHYAAGETVYAELTLTNGSEQEWFFHRWHDDRDMVGHRGNIRFVLLNEQKQWATNVRVGQWYRQGVPYALRRVKPGESIKLKVGCYDLPAPGTYTLHAIYRSKGPFEMGEDLPIWEGELRSNEIPFAVAKPIDLGKSSIQFEGHEMDDVESELLAVGRYPRTPLEPSAKEVYLRRRAGKLAAGPPYQELVGRMPFWLPSFNAPGGSRLIVDRFERKGANIVAKVRHVAGKSFQPGDYVRNAVYLRATLPDDLPPGHYWVKIKFESVREDANGDLIPLPGPSLGGMACDFEVPANATINASPLSE